MRRLFIFSVVLLLVGTFGGAASASVPRARLIAGEHGQNGNVRSSCGGDTCVGEIGWFFPAAKRASAGERAKIRIQGATPVTNVDLDGWRRVTPTVEGPEPAGRQRDFRLRIRPMKRDGLPVGWLVQFRLPAREGDLYLDLFVRRSVAEHANYTFHLDLR